MFQFLQHIEHDVLLCGGNRMQVVSLELICGNAFQQEWQHQDAILVREARIDIMELRDVGFSVIRRQPNADQQHFGAGALRLFDDVAQIGLDVPDGSAAQPVIRAEFHDHDSRAMLLQCLGDALPPAGGGLAADAGVHDAESGLRALQFLL